MDIVVVPAAVPGTTTITAAVVSLVLCQTTLTTTMK